VTEGHAHGADHDHSHGHDGVSDGPENPWAGQGSVLLDIGGDVGALVVEMPAGMTGREIEIRPVTDTPATSPVHHPHVAVVARRVGDTTVPSLVYPDLVTGSYELYEKGTQDVEMTADVVGGQVTQLAWPG
jgi:hypothetical protein